MKQMNDFNFNESIFKRLLQAIVPLLAEHEELLFTSILRALAAGTRKCNKAKQLLFSVWMKNFACSTTTSYI